MGFFAAQSVMIVIEVLVYTTLAFEHKSREIIDLKEKCKIMMSDFTLIAGCELRETQIAIKIDKYKTVVANIFSHPMNYEINKISERPSKLSVQCKRKEIKMLNQNCADSSTIKSALE